VAWPFLVALQGSLLATQALQPNHPPAVSAGRAYLGIDVLPHLQSPSVLLTFESVRDEVGLTVDQREALKKVEASSARNHEHLMKQVDEEVELLKSRQASFQERLNLADRVDGQRRGMIADLEAAKVRVLSPAQRARLEQIRLQAEGPAAFNRPEIQDRLNMSPEQAEEIKAIVSQGREQAVRVSALPPDLAEARLGIQTAREREQLAQSKNFASGVEGARNLALGVREATMREIERSLTKRQRERYRRMLGEPFDLATIRPRGASTAARRAP
jgi:hypothetical protein